MIKLKNKHTFLKKYINWAKLMWCNLDLVTLVVSAKNVTKSHYLTKANYLM